MYLKGNSWYCSEDGPKNTLIVGGILVSASLRDRSRAAVPDGHGTETCLFETISLSSNASCLQCLTRHDASNIQVGRIWRTLPVDAHGC